MLDVINQKWTLSGGVSHVKVYTDEPCKLGLVFHKKSINLGPISHKLRKKVNLDAFEEENLLEMAPKWWKLQKKKKKKQ